tara:strand:- start:436 stop:714 length:279 start_codon:yes stop_codon:yes gene_type:complete
MKLDLVGQFVGVILASGREDFAACGGLGLGTIEMDRNERVAFCIIANYSSLAERLKNVGDSRHHHTNMFDKYPPRPIRHIESIVGFFGPVWS